MRILFLTPQPPFPPRQGTQIRNYHLLRAVTSAHQVDLLSFARPGEMIDPSSPLRQMCGSTTLLPVPRRGRGQRFRALVTSSEPDMGQRLASNSFTMALRQALHANSYDLVQVEGIEMARFIPVVRSTSPTSSVVFDDHNAEYLLQARAASVDARHPASWPKALYSLLQWAKLRRYERWACSLADAVLAVSDDDAAALRRLVPGVDPRVVPNGVDTDHYRPADSENRDPGRLLFTGTMDYRPNVDAVRWFVYDVLPEIRRRSPGTLFYIVGRSPSRSVLRLVDGRKDVTVTGPVDDVRPYFDRSAVFVVPMRMGGGVRLKILEALSMGLPVVSTTMGAEGTGLLDGREIVLADTAAEFTAAVLRLMEDGALRGRLALAGRQVAETRFDWGVATPRLLGLYEEIERRREGGRG